MLILGALGLGVPRPPPVQVPKGPYKASSTFSFFEIILVCRILIFDKCNPGRHLSVHERIRLSETNGLFTTISSAFKDFYWSKNYYGPETPPEVLSKRWMALVNRAFPKVHNSRRIEHQAYH